MALFFGGRPQEVKLETIIPIAIAYIINLLLNAIKYSNSIFLFYVSRSIYLVIIAFITLLNIANPFKCMIAISCYFFIILEMQITSKQNSMGSQVINTVTATLPILVANIFVLLFTDTLEKFNIDVMIFFAFVVCMFYFIIHVVSTHVVDLEDKILVQSKLYNDAKQANETLLVTQQKFKQANELLGRQKLDLEQAYAKINRANSEIYIQNELLSYISSALEIYELMEVVTDSIIGAIGVDTCALIITDPVTGKTLTNIKSTSGKVVEQALKNYALEGKLTEYYEKGQVLVDNNVDSNKYPFMTQQIGSLLLMPLMKNNIGYGILIAGQKQKDMFTDNVSFFNSIANQINIAVSNANLYSKMENMASRDGLTQVYNRAYLTKKFNELVSNAVQSNVPISLALFDIDKFKKVNDTYGHMFGDEAIKVVAHIAEEFAEHNNGMVGRFGGEEFVVILPGTGVQKAYEIVQEMHEGIKKKALYFGEEEVHINVSIGLTCYPDTCKNPSDLLNRADWSCYYSKQNGRGKITIDNDSIRKEINM
jgi:diguanylate cyclase (GGDEF)-like protein